MKKHKQSINPTNDSERSPSVHYANWKETIFLGKKLATINKTEQGIVHRITVDQKVMFRRFQHMLNRTKITQARVIDDKQTIKRLQGEKKHRLHCESHLNNGEDAGFLKKLKKSPCTFDSAEDKRKYLETKRNCASKRTTTDQEMIALIQTVMDNGDIEHTPSNLTHLSALGRILDAANHQDNENPNPTAPLKNTPDRLLVTSSKTTPIFKGRSASGRDTHKGGQYGVDLRAFNENDTKSLSGESTGNMKNTMSTDYSDSSSELSGNGKKQCVKTSEKNTVLPSLKLTTEKSVTNVEPVNGDWMASRTPPSAMSLNRPDDAKVLTPRPTKEPASKRISSIFEEVKRPDVHGMRLQEALRADYTGQVKDFIDSLSTFGQGVPDFDYYASKMQLDAASLVKSVRPTEMPSTPEHVYRKHTGDTTIKCITLPEIKLNRGDSGRHEDYDIFYADDIMCFGAPDTASSYSSDDDEGIE